MVIATPSTFPSKESSLSDFTKPLLMKSKPRGFLPGDPERVPEEVRRTPRRRGFPRVRPDDTETIQEEDWGTGVEGLHLSEPETYRVTHIAIRELEEKGVVDELGLAKYAGHLRVETTRIYIHLATKHIAFGRRRYEEGS